MVALAMLHNTMSSRELDRTTPGHRNVVTEILTEVHARSCLRHLMLHDKQAKFAVHEEAANEIYGAPSTRCSESERNATGHAQPEVRCTTGSMPLPVYRL